MMGCMDILIYIAVILVPFYIVYRAQKHRIYIELVKIRVWHHFHSVKAVADRDAVHLLRLDRKMNERIDRVRLS